MAGISHGWSMNHSLSSQNESKGVPNELFPKKERGPKILKRGTQFWVKEGSKGIHFRTVQKSHN